MSFKARYAPLPRRRSSIVASLGMKITDLRALSAGLRSGRAGGGDRSWGAAGKRGRWLVLLCQLILSRQLGCENSLIVGFFFFLFREVSVGLVLSAAIGGFGGGERPVPGQGWGNQAGISVSVPARRSIPASAADLSQESRS